MKYLVLMMALLPLNMLAHPGHDTVVSHSAWVSVTGSVLLAAAIFLATTWLKRKMAQYPVKK